MEPFLKKQLFETGYISFKLKEFDEKIYNSLKVLFPPGSLNPQQFNNLKASIIKKKIMILTHNGQTYQMVNLKNLKK
jgi:hypothetical protein